MRKPSLEKSRKSLVVLLIFMQTFCLGQLNYYLKGGGNMSNVFHETFNHQRDTLSATGSSFDSGIESKRAFGGYLTFEALKKTGALECGMGVQFELIRENYYVKDGIIYFDSDSEMRNFILSGFSVAIAPQLKYNFDKFSLAFTIEIPFIEFIKGKEVSKEGEIKIDKDSYESNRNTLCPTLSFFYPLSNRVCAMANISLYKTKNTLLRLGVNIDLSRKSESVNK